MLKNLFLLITIFSCTTLFAQTWDGGGSSSSWDDPLNWSTDTIPAEGATVIFPYGTDANISGSAPNAIRRIVFDTSTIITLDLDLNFGGPGTAVHNMIFNESASVTLGGTTEMRTFNFVSATNRNGMLINSNGVNITISEQATLNMDSCSNAMRMSKLDATFVNNGTLNLMNYTTHGINVFRGTFTNNGTITIGVGIEDGDPTSDGINIAEEGVFDNSAEGNITITKPLDDGIEVLGIFNNAGIISATSKDDAIATNAGFSIGTAEMTGTINNMASGVINADGGIGDQSRVVRVDTLGVLNNAGAMNVTNGIGGQALLNYGALTNEACARIDMIECRILNNNTGVLINNGLINSSWTAAGINHGATDGSALNNAFYRYTNPNVPFTGGTAESTDNGQNASANIVVDAENSCTVTDIGIDVPYTWYADMAGTIEVGTNDENGLLVFNDDVFAVSGTQTLYTCFGEEVQLEVQNVLGECALTVGVDLVQLTDVFTLMPNPTQTFTTIKFGTDYISNEKSIEVYNSVGQLVHAVNLTNVENYILNTNNLAVGIYTVNLQTEKGMQIERLVIQK